MRILLAWILVSLFGSLSFAESEEFPARLRGTWGDSNGTCDTLRTDDPMALRKDQRWLGISVKNVLGSTQGRFLREIPAQALGGAATELSFEIQVLDERGSIVRLTLSADGRLYETALGAFSRAAANYRKC